MKNLIIVTILFIAMSLSGIEVFADKPLGVICEANQSQLKDGIYYATMEYYDPSRQINVNEIVKVDVYSDFVTDVYDPRSNVVKFSTKQKNLNRYGVKTSGGKITVVKHFQNHTILSAKATVTIYYELNLMTYKYIISLTKLIHAY